MTIHGVCRNWTVDRGADSTMLADEREYLRDLGGGVPLKVLATLSDADLERLVRWGYLEIGLRLDHGGGRLDDPEGWARRQAERLRQLAAVARRADPRVYLWGQIGNEQNKENAAMGAAAYYEWLLITLALLKAGCPEIGEWVFPPLCGAWPNAWQWWETAGRAAAARFDTLGADIYWACPDHMRVDAPWGARWWLGQAPGKKLRILECGGADGTTEDWRFETYRPMLDTFLANEDVLSVHFYALGFEDTPGGRHWEELGHRYTPRLRRVIADASIAWRALRPFREAV